MWMFLLICRNAGNGGFLTSKPHFEFLESRKSGLVETVLLAVHGLVWQACDGKAGR